MPTTYSLYPGMIHSLLAVSAVLAAAECVLVEIAAELRSTFPLA